MQRDLNEILQPLIHSFLWYNCVMCRFSRTTLSNTPIYSTPLPNENKLKILLDLHFRFVNLLSISKLKSTDFILPSIKEKRQCFKHISIHNTQCQTKYVSHRIERHITPMNRNKVSYNNIELLKHSHLFKYTYSPVIFHGRRSNFLYTHCFMSSS